MSDMNFQEPTNQFGDLLLVFYASTLYLVESSKMFGSGVFTPKLIESEKKRNERNGNII